MVKIIQRRKIWFALSIAMVVVSVFAYASWGLKFGIDYTGGTQMEVKLNGVSLSNQEIKDALAELNLGEINVQPSSQGTVFLKLKNIDEATNQSILSALNKKATAKAGTSSNAATNSAAPAAVPTDQSQAPAQVTAKDANGNDVAIEAQPVTADSAISQDGSTITSQAGAAAETPQYVSEKSFESIGPSVGSEQTSNAIWAVIVAVMAIILYISWAFRKVSHPIESYKYGIIAAVALLHDLLSVIGIFAILGHFRGIEIDITFVAALLTILGYSVHDTIVVFDRIRENLFRYQSGDFETTVNNCVNETLIRSINTSFTVVLILTVMFFFGGSTIQYFILALIVGVTFGTYSSIFLASPLLVTWQQYDLKKKTKK